MSHHTHAHVPHWQGGIPPPAREPQITTLGPLPPHCSWARRQPPLEGMPPHHRCLFLQAGTAGAAATQPGRTTTCLHRVYPHASPCPARFHGLPPCAYASTVMAGADVVTRTAHMTWQPQGFFRYTLLSMLGGAPASGTRAAAALVWAPRAAVPCRHQIFPGCWRTLDWVSPLFHMTTFWCGMVRHLCPSATSRHAGAALYPMRLLRLEDS